MSATSLLLFYLILALSSPSCLLLHLSFYLNLIRRSDRNCLLSPPVQSDYNGSPDTRFYRATTRLISWPDGERYLCLQHAFEVSFVLSLVSTLLFSPTRGVLSHLNSSTHRFPQFSLRNLCSDAMLAGHSLLLSSYLSRIGRIENPSCGACGHPSYDTSHLILHCPATDSLRRRSWTIFCFSTTSSPGSGKLPGFWGPWSSAMPPSLGRGRVTTTTIKLKLGTQYYVTKRVSKFIRS